MSPNQPLWKAPPEEEVFRTGKSLLEKVSAGEKEWASHHPWENRLLEWSIQKPELRTRIFRFIDAYPQIAVSGSVFTHIREYFPSSEDRIPAWIRKGLDVTGPSFVTRKAVERLTKVVFEKMSALFVGAQDAAEAVEKIKLLEKKGVWASADLLGERTISDSEADDCARRYADLIGLIGAADLPADARNISVKLSALDPRFDAADPEGVGRRLRSRVAPLLELARANGVLFHVDMEEYAARDLILDCIERWVEGGLLRNIRIGVVLQAYLRDAWNSLERMEMIARKLDHPLTIRLVRGAYWDTEVMEAAERRVPVPVWTRKDQTDLQYEKLILAVAAKKPFLELALGTHNVRSIAYLLAAEAVNGVLAEPHNEFQVLHGLGDSLIAPLRGLNRRVRVYLPVGDPVRGIAYLVRRLLENSSSQSFIRQAYHGAGRTTEVLAPPFQTESPAPEPDEPMRVLKTRGIEWHRPAERDRIAGALARVRSELGSVLASQVGGEAVGSVERAVRVSPLDGMTPTAETICAGEAEIDLAVTRARQEESDWMERPVKDRADCLKRTAEVIRSFRAEFTALAVVETGKPVTEADADVVEAADFLDYYADQALCLGEKVLHSLVQEKNERRSRPRGVTAVISPWNFPVAIPAGMCAAALVTGNAVLFKPSELAPLCGWKLYEAFLRGGIPESALAILFGAEETGKQMVRHPEVKTVAFTGSYEAGRDISSASVQLENQVGFRKLILELGGKNSLIVDASADLDALVPAVLYSAFGFAGQKCSALSRLIVHRAVYDAVITRLAAAAGSFPVGNPEEAWVRCGPVISEGAKARLERIYEETQSLGRVLFKSDPVVFGGGHYVPLLIADRLPESARAVREELFGPILAVIRADDIDQAIRIANHLPFGLTGGIFSRTPSSIQKARQKLDVGNLYINRAITGAAVSRQPFGGFKNSGTGSKAGGPDYLAEFVLNQTVSENLLRHGFTPTMSAGSEAN